MNRKKLLLIVDDFLPHSTKVAAKMMYDLAISLKNQGNDVLVLTPLSSLDKNFELRDVQGVNVLFFKSGRIKNLSKVRRAINETLLSYRAWKNCQTYFAKNRFDGIVYYSPSIFWGNLVGKLKKQYQVKSYLILRDIFPQWTIDNGLMRKNSLIHKYFKYFERINYTQADKIGVMSNANKQWCVANFLNPEKFEVLPNWTRINPTVTQTDSLRKKLHLEDKVIFFYGGNIGHAQDMDNLMQLAIQMKNNEKAHFLFVGKGDEVELILERKKEYHLNNVTYIPSVNQEEYFRMLSEIDVGLFNLHPDHKTHNFPGKLLGYMEYSKPILGCVNPGNDLKTVITNAKAGFIFDKSEQTAFFQATESLINSSDLRTEMGKNGFLLLKKTFDVKEVASRLNLFFEK